MGELPDERGRGPYALHAYHALTLQKWTDGIISLAELVAREACLEMFGCFIEDLPEEAQAQVRQVISEVCEKIEADAKDNR